MEMLRDVSAYGANEFSGRMRRNVEGVVSVLFVAYQASFWKLSCLVDFIIAPFPSSPRTLFTRSSCPICL